MSFKPWYESMKCPTCGSEMIYDYDNMYYVCPRCGTIIEDPVAESSKMNNMEGRAILISGDKFSFTKNRRVQNYNSVLTLTERAISILETSSCISIDDRIVRPHILHLAQQALAPLLGARRQISKKLSFDIASFIAYTIARQFLIPLCETPKYSKSALFKVAIRNIKIPKVKPNPFYLINYIANKTSDPEKAKKGLTLIAKAIIEYAPLIPIVEPDITSFFSVLASSATFSQFLKRLPCKKGLHDVAARFTIKAIQSLKDPSIILEALNTEHRCAKRTIAFLPHSMAERVYNSPMLAMVSFEYGIWLSARNPLPRVEDDWEPVEVMVAPPSLAKCLKTKGKDDLISAYLYLGLSNLS